MWFPWCLRHGAMDPVEGNHWGEWGRADLRIYTFYSNLHNLVMSLSTVKQSAIPFLTIFVTSRRSCRLWTLGPFQFCSSEAARNSRKHLFCHRDTAECIRLVVYIIRGIRHVLFLQVWSFGIWWDWTYRVPNSFELEQPFNAHLWVWPTTVTSREQRTTFFLGTESHFISCCCFAHVHQLVHHSVPYFMCASLLR